MTTSKTNQRTRWCALCRREWLEHRVALGWAPLGLLGLTVLATALVVSGISPSGETMSVLNFQAALLYFVKPFTWLYLAAAVIVLLGSLVEERKDRTILFWKSMPVTDTQTVLSKLLLVCGIGSVISASAIISAQVSAVLLATLFASDGFANGASNLWAAAQLGSSVVNWLCGYFSQMFWLLPLWGWLLLVSAVARGSTLFWAVAVPFVVAFVEWVFFRSDHIASSILRHVDLRALPTHIGEHSTVGRSANELTNRSPDYLLQLAELWSSSSMWLGILVGCLFIAAAIFFRGRNNEL